MATEKSDSRRSTSIKVINRKMAIRKVRRDKPEIDEKFEMISTCKNDKRLLDNFTTSTDRLFPYSVE